MSVVANEHIDPDRTTVLGLLPDDAPRGGESLDRSPTLPTTLTVVPQQTEDKARAAALAASRARLRIAKGELGARYEIALPEDHIIVVVGKGRFGHPVCYFLDETETILVENGKPAYISIWRLYAEAQRFQSEVKKWLYSLLRETLISELRLCADAGRSVDSEMKCN